MSAMLTSSAGGVVSQTTHTQNWIHWLVHVQNQTWRHDRKVQSNVFAHACHEVFSPKLHGAEESDGFRLPAGEPEHLLRATALDSQSL